MEVISKNTLHGGMNLVVRHDSVVTSCPMELSIYIPPGKGPFPCLYYLSGLTCTWENAATKAGAQAYAAKAGIVLVFPDTSPRGDDIADDDAFSLGKGAGYYMDATEQPWAKHYQMDSYITKELPKIVSAHASIDHDRCGITGHSMGGHGALMLAMKNPGQYRSVSAFAPIASLASAPWGKVVIDAYRGGSNAELYDVCKLMASHGWSGQILVDQGEADNFKDEHLMPDKLVAAAAKNNIDLTLRLQEGYDHSYWFVASFIEDHINWHAARLR